MGSARFGVAGLVPDGPLHPDDAGIALAVGLGVAIVVHRRPRLVLTAVSLAALVAFHVRYPAELSRVADHESGPAGLAVAVFAAAGLAVVLARLAAMGVAAVAPVVVVALSVSWMIVPDTEAPLIFGAVCVGALAGAAVLGRGLVLVALPWAAVLAVAWLPVIAALVGTRGRPERLWPSLGASLGVAAVAAVGQWLWRRQRAGTPTTVAPGSTSDATTAPAPTTAP